MINLVKVNKAIVYEFKMRLPPYQNYAD